MVVLAVALPALLWAAPLAVFLLLFPVPSQVESHQLTADLPRFVEVGERERTLRTSVSASLVYSEALVARSAVSGLVTAKHVQPGGVVEAGKPLVDVDGIAVLAYVGDEPFFRDLRPEDEGPDVQRLNVFLAQLGHATDTSSDWYSWDTARATRSLQEALGVKPDGVFRTTYVSFVPSSLTSVVDVPLTVGAQVAAGDDVLVGNTPIAAVSFVASDENHTLKGLNDVPVSLEVGGQVLTAGSLSLVPEEVQAFETAARQAGLLQTGSDEKSIPGLYVQLQEAQVVGSVPGTAVHFTSAGEACLFAAEGDEYRAVKVTGQVQPGDEVGQTTVARENVGSRVVRDATSLSESVLSTCT